MPPANSPNATHGTSTPTNRSLTPLSYLSSPVPDLASTLFSQAEGDADDENVRFLRTPLDDLQDASPAASSQRSNHADPRHTRLQRQLNQLRRYPQTGDDEPTQTRDAQSRERMMRVLSRLSRFEENSQESGSSNLNFRHPPPRAHQADDRDQTALRDRLDTLTRQIGEEHVRSTETSGERDRDYDRFFDQYQGWRPDMESTTRQNDMSGTSSREDRNETHSFENPVESYNRRHDNLRSTAIMQHARLSNSTERMLRYIRNREQTGDNEHDDQNDESQGASRSWSINMTDLNGQTDSSPRHSGTRTPWRPSGVDRYRREYLADPPYHRLNSRYKTSSHAVSPFLENAIKYLARLQDCHSYQDALDAAIDTGFANKEFFADKHDDFTMDFDNKPPVAPSSWLQPGAKFSGSQHTTFPSDLDRSTFRPLGYPNNVSWEPSRPFDATRPWLSHNPTIPRIHPDTTSNPTSAYSQPLEKWPVKMTIHSIDEDHMTISGTMEAYDVPNHNHQPGTKCSSTSPITTYVEGQIIDLVTHTFLTPPPSNLKPAPGTTNAMIPQPVTRPVDSTKITFPPTTPAIDAANWRRLPPFNAIEDDNEVARILLSQDRMAAVNDEYIFMRWKERCFIHEEGDGCVNSPRRSRQANPVSAAGRVDDARTMNGRVTTHRRSNGEEVLVRRLGEGDDTDTGHGLTISGFYYVSLRRADGAVEGLYFDPSTSPYQCLRLEGVRAAVGGAAAWEFR